MDLITALRMVLESNMASHYFVGDEMVLLSQTRIQKPWWTSSRHKKMVSRLMASDYQVERVLMRQNKIWT